MHCTYCGHPFEVEAAWPRTCQSCGNTSYRNPIPVVVCILPVEEGVLVVRRKIPPAVGKLALPGGFLDYGESWQEGVVRELKEETGIQVSADEVELFHVESTPEANLVLIFGTIKPRSAQILSAFQPNDEVEEILLIKEAQELAFPIHTAVLKRFLAK